ncbi:MAG TPA: phosphatase PAP2 family protein [Acidimicrobiales bacterium]
MTAGTVVAPATSATADQPAAPIHWWREIAYVVVFYGIYTLVRNQFGSATVGAQHAFDNAVRIIDLEKALGIFNEATVQGWFLDAPGVLRAFNIFYGSFHFVVTAGVLAWLAWRFPRDYPAWRNTLMIGTALALVGFSLFPLMPPRLLCDCPYGAGPVASADGLPHFVDTLAEHGGLWSFDSGTMQAVSNQYAAMPSLHFGWALWCALALVPRLRHRWSKGLAAAYPVVTLLAIVVTGNHFWLDAVGGAVVIGLGWLIGSRLAGVMRRRQQGRGTVTRAPVSTSPSVPADPSTGPDPSPHRRTGKERAAS